MRTQIYCWLPLLLFLIFISSVCVLSASAQNEPKVLDTFDNPLPAPLDNKYGVFLLEISIWTVIAIGVVILFDVIMKRIARRTKTKIDDIVLAIVRTPLLVLLVAYAFVCSLDVLNLPSAFMNFIQLGYQIVLVLAILWIVYRVIKDIVVYYGKLYAVKTKTKIDDILIPIAEKASAVIIVIVGIVYILSYTGVDLTIFAVGGIVVSMVIAFALQDTLSNFFSGIYLLADRPFKEGDWIKLESGEICEVKKIGLRTTRLYAFFDHHEIILPNNALVNQKIINIVEPDLQIKIKINVGVAYGSDIATVKNILYKVAEEHPNVVKSGDKKPIVRFTQFGDSSLNFLLMVWVDNVKNQWKVSSDLHEAIDREFRLHNVVIPFPQRVVWHQYPEKEKGG